MKHHLAGLGVLVVWLMAAPLRGQVANDTCATAIPIASAAVVGTNVGATAGPDPLPTCLTMTGDVWYSFTPPCSGLYTVSTCAAATTFGTIVAVWDGAAGCGGLSLLACSDVCVAGAFSGASCTVSLTVGHAYFVSVGGNGGSTGTFGLSLTLGAAMTLSFFTQGPGSLGYFITDGPDSGTAFVAITANAGSFPFGWFYGIDIHWVELINEISAGYPFLNLLLPCGMVVVGPFTGLPSGLVLYAVGLGIQAGASVPSFATTPLTGSVP